MSRSEHIQTEESEKILLRFGDGQKKNDLHHTEYKCITRGCVFANQKKTIANRKVWRECFYMIKMTH